LKPDELIPIVKIKSTSGVFLRYSPAGQPRVEQGPRVACKKGIAVNVNKKNQRYKTVAVLVAALLVLAAVLAYWKIEERRSIGQKGALAYLYALPLVLMDITREEMFKHPAAAAAEPNRFYTIPVLADHTFRTVIRPNVDTLYSAAWLDLAEEPVLLTIPPSDGRYHVEQFMDAWTNVFFAPGIRTLGNAPGRFLIALPTWKGQVPEGYQRIDAPTSMAWILGRVFVNGASDLEAARRYQRSIDLRPLSALDNAEFLPALPDIKGRGAKRADPIDIVRSMDSQAFFARFKRLASQNPPAPADAPFIQDVLQPLGLDPAAHTAFHELPASTRRDIDAGIAEVWSVMSERIAVEGEKTPTGWAGLSTAKHIGAYGTDYKLRAGVAVFGLGANIPEDAIYLNAGVDSTGRELAGGRDYTLTFAASALPPVKGFWSVTLYDRKGYLLDNPIQRYNLRISDPLHYNEDGSLTLLVQPDKPADERMHANWLPSPRDGNFVLSMRLYWPDQDVLDGKWMPPALVPAHRD